MALLPKGDRPYLFGLHQCSRARTWTKEEQRLFEEVGHRLTDALGSLIAFRGLRESEARLEAAQRLARVGWWERDYATGHVSLSDEACRVFGVQPLELPQWHGRWLSLIHPEDREKAAAAATGRCPAVRATTSNTGWCGPTVPCAWCTARETSRGRSPAVPPPVRGHAGHHRVAAAERRLEGGRASGTSAGGSATTPPHAWLIETDEIAEIYLASMRPDSVIAPRTVNMKLACRSHHRRTAGTGRASTFAAVRYEHRVPPPRSPMRNRTAHRPSRRDSGGNVSGRAARQFAWRRTSPSAAGEAEVRARQDMLDLAQKAARAVAFDWYIGAREARTAGRPSSRPSMVWSRARSIERFQGWKKLVHPDDWPWVDIALTADESGDIEAEYRVVQGDGSVRWLQAKGRCSLTPRGARAHGRLHDDVTQRRQAEEELRASEARFRTFVDHATDAFFLHDEQADVIDVNRQACESLGFSRDELIGMHPRDFDATSTKRRSPIAKRARRRNGHLRDAPSTQGRDRVPGRDPHTAVQAGGQALRPGARARHQRAQARRGDLARKGQRAAVGADGARARVAVTTLGELTPRSRTRLTSPSARWSRTRARRALAGGRAARYGEGARGARAHRRRRQARERDHRADPRADQAPGAAQERLDLNARFAKSSRSRSMSCAERHRARACSAKRCRACRVTGCSCSRCCST